MQTTLQRLERELEQQAQVVPRRAPWQEAVFVLIPAGHRLAHCKLSRCQARGRFCIPLSSSCFLP
jgi:hypothetical protein